MHLGCRMLEVNRQDNLRQLVSVLVHERTGSGPPGHVPGCEHEREVMRPAGLGLVGPVTSLGQDERHAAGVLDRRRPRGIVV